MSRKPHPSILFIIPLMLFLFSFSLRLSLISKGPYDVDCLSLAIQAKQSLETHEMPFLHRHGYPLTALLGMLFVFLFNVFSNNDPVLAVNVMSVLFGSLAVVALYFFTDKLFDRLTAFFAALIFSVSPFFLSVSEYGSSHTPFAFFLFLGLDRLVSYLRGQRYRYLIFSGLLFGLAGAARVQDMVLLMVPVSVLCFLSVNFKDEKGASRPAKRLSLMNYFIFLLVILFTTVGFYAPFFAGKYQSRLQEAFQFFFAHELSTSFIGIVSAALLKSIEHLLFNSTILGLLMTLCGIYFLWNQNKKILSFLILWLSLPLFVYGNLDFLTPRFLIIAVIPIVLIQSFLLTQLFFKGRFTKALSVATFVLLIYLTFANIYPLVKFRHQNALLPDFALWVAKVTEPDAIIISKDDHQFYEYYSKRQVVSRPSDKFTISPDSLESFKIQMDEYLSKNIPLYITDTGLRAYDTENVFNDFMNQNYQLSLIGKRLSQRWQKGDTILWVGWEKFYRIRRK